MHVISAFVVLEYTVYWEMWWIGTVYGLINHSHSLMVKFTIQLYASRAAWVMHSMTVIFHKHVLASYIWILHIVHEPDAL